MKCTNFRTNGNGDVKTGEHQRAIFAREQIGDDGGRYGGIGRFTDSYGPTPRQKDAIGF